MSVLNLFIATITFCPKIFFKLSICLYKFFIPFFNASIFSFKIFSFGTPPWYFNAFIVATHITTSGFICAFLHFISINFSAPKSAPNPASVTVYSASSIPNFVAITELHPCAILANGPPCIIAGVCSNVCTRFVFIASFNNTAIAPSAFKSLENIGSSFLLYPIIIFPSLCFNSSIFSDKHTIAIISEATDISNPSSLGTILLSPDSPVCIFLNCLSFKSTHLFHTTFSICNLFP